MVYRLALLEVNNLKKVYTTRFGGNQVRGAVQRLLLGRGGGIRRHHGRVRLRQDDPAQHPRRPRPADERGGAARRDEHRFRHPGQGDLPAFRRDNLGFVFQDFNLLDTFTLQDNIFLPLVLSGKTLFLEMRRTAAPDRSEARHRGHPAKSTPTRSPAGRSSAPPWPGPLITGPQLVLADEPTGALDSRATDALLRLFDDINHAGPDHPDGHPQHQGGQPRQTRAVYQGRQAVQPAVPRRYGPGVSFLTALSPTFLFCLTGRVDIGYEAEAFYLRLALSPTWRRRTACMVHAEMKTLFCPAWPCLTSAKTPAPVSPICSPASARSPYSSSWILRAVANVIYESYGGAHLAGGC